MMRMFRGKELDKKLAAAIKKSVTTEASWGFYRCFVGLTPGRERHSP